MKASYTFVRKYEVKAYCETPFHTGDADGTKERVLVHPMEGVPFIQASGIAGVCSEYIKENYGEEIQSYWFGSSSGGEKGAGNTSKLIFSDGVFKKDTISLELRPHIKLNGASGTVQEEQQKGKEIVSGQITNIEVVSGGSEFCFTVYQMMDGLKEDKVAEWFLSGMDHGEIFLGGQLSIGYGKVKIFNVVRTEFDLSDEKDLEAWMTDEQGEKEDITAEIQRQGKGILPYYVIKAEIDFKNSVLVRGNVTDTEMIAELLNKNEEDLPYISASNMVNGKGQLEIPGSSFKGSVRGRVEAIADYLKVDNELLEQAFENRSKVWFYDSELTNKEMVRLTARNAINKMTGGVKHGALFFEALAGGKTAMTIRISKAQKIDSQWKEESVKAMIALIILALRDFSVGIENFGGGASVGRGFADFDKIIVKDGDCLLAEISPNDDQTQDENGFIKSCLDALNHRRALK